MLAGSDDIIRQHKAACLRVTALLAVRDRLWVRPPFLFLDALSTVSFKQAHLRYSLVPATKAVSQVGTSAGVIVTLGLPHITATTTKLPSPPPLSGWINAGLGLTDQ